MEISHLQYVLNGVKYGKIEVDEALNELKELSFEDIGYAKIDHNRKIRNGFPEVIYCEGKKIEQVKEIFLRLSYSNKNILATRASHEIYLEIKTILPEVLYYEDARIIALKRDDTITQKGKIGVLTAGTSDIPVAEEASITAEIMGNLVDRFYDVGVAGIHRLFNRLDDIKECRVLVVVAGMEGALASVVGGLIDKPIIAVPTSIGYGTNFGGLSALLTMLNSCVSGVGVVNIDNGFGAGYLASMINRLE